MDFLTHSVAEKAGFIEIRMGHSAPIIYDTSFTWPSSPEITRLEYDSRKVIHGSLFFALTGLHADGHNFINDAVSRGAAVVIHQNELNEYKENVIYIRAKNSRFAMSPIADAFYDFPSRHMGVIGITGTEGKSTTVYFTYQLLKLVGKKTGFISTVQQADGITEKWNDEHQTTPEAPTVHRLLAEMRQNGVEFVVVESSSHGLSKKTNRLGDVDFDVAVMTTLTHDHLEFHGTWENYRSDKAELFRALDSSPSSHKKQFAGKDISIPSFCVVNVDYTSGEYFAAATKQKSYSYSAKGAKADLSLRRIISTSGGNSYELFISSSEKIITLHDNLPGAFNASNVLAGLLVVSNLFSISIEDLAPLVPQLKPVRGRMTHICRGQPFEVIVDFAHTPSSFEAALAPLRERLNSTSGQEAKGRIICLFGSAGERDTQKRPQQGEIAARYSDIVFLADEDPRGEEPMAILEEIAKGCLTGSGCEHMKRDETLFLIPNRPEAIRKAFSIAKQGDLVILLGKGHENSIIYANETIVYDEITEAVKALEEMGYKKL